MSDFRDYREEGRSRWERRWDARMERQNNRGHIWMGLFLVAVGGIALVRSFGVPVPAWLFSWQMLVICIGLFIGIKKGFSDGGWFLPIIVGGAFLLNDYVLKDDLRRHIWPLILILFGLFFVFRAGKKRWGGKPSVAAAEPGLNKESAFFEEYTKDDFVDSTCIFSGAKKVILSKNFRGGDITNIFGGSEIDLTQADMLAPATMDVTAIFGGATLIIPSNWAIKSEAVTVFGGISDKRKIMPLAEGPSKTLVLKGTILFGGIEIKSY